MKLLKKYGYILALIFFHVSNLFAMEGNDLDSKEDLLSQGIEKRAHLILIRHGVSEHNQALKIVKEDGSISYNYRYNSNPEHPNYKPSNLLEEGVAQVVNTAKRLHNDGIYAIDTIAYVSPLPRTQQSAEILIQHGVIGESYTTDKRIIEEQAGELEGEFGNHPETNQKRSQEDKEANKYESREMLAKRVQQFVCSLQDFLSRIDTKNIVIVSHAEVLKMMIQIFDPNAQVEFKPGSYLEYDLSFDPDKPNELGKLIL